MIKVLKNQVSKNLLKKGATIKIQKIEIPFLRCIHIINTEGKEIGYIIFHINPYLPEVVVEHEKPKKFHINSYFDNYSFTIDGNKLKLSRI